MIRVPNIEETENALVAVQPDAIATSSKTFYNKPQVCHVFACVYIRFVCV